MAMAFLTSYVFLLRMPSGCLPLKVGPVVGAGTNQSVVVCTAQSITLHLSRRKNKDGGSVLKRTCWCNSCAELCPVHVLGPYFASCGTGAQPFARFDARCALANLRTCLQALGIVDAFKYRTHDIRRGHARDLQLGGASLYEILRAGEWRSPAFLSYMDKMELECGAALEAHLEDSSDDDRLGLAGA